MRRVSLLVGLSMIAAAPVQAVGGFGDVADGYYYTAPVQWMSDAGISSGTRPGCFTPESTATRAEAATFLHRSVGAPPADPASMADVSPSDFFAEAVGWMVTEGITTGADTGLFEPYRQLTRGEIATFLYRTHGAPATALSSFTDVPADAFYAEPVAWMVSEGISTGASDTTFEPNRAVTRAEIATFLYRAAGSPAVSIDYSGYCDAWPDLSAAEAASFELLNQLRADLGLSRLTRDASLDQAARDWSRTMDQSGFRHSSLPYYENIAWWSAGSITPEAAAQRMHDMWVNSPGHYSNMTRPGHTVVGVGFWRSSDGWHATHMLSG
jgi:uncharacterized protein YkwD